MITIPSQEELWQMASRWLPPSHVAHRFRIHTDTTDFFRVDYDSGLAFLVGMKDVLLPTLKQQGHPALDTLIEEDLNIAFTNRVANLKKIYPYLPESLNRMLMHFSKGTNWFYENTDQLLDDLKAYQTSTPTLKKPEESKNDQ